MATPLLHGPLAAEGGSDSKAELDVACIQSTDKTSLSLGTLILESAMVLGQPGPKHSSNRSLIDVNESTFISEDGPLNQWSEEAPVPWSEWYANNNIRTEEME